MLVEREKRERTRAAITTAAIMNTGMAQRKDGKPWTALDVFPDLREDVHEEEEENLPIIVGGDPAIVMARFQALMAREKAMAEA